jgi:hypothetical protein
LQIRRDEISSPVRAELARHGVIDLDVLDKQAECKLLWTAPLSRFRRCDTIYSSRGNVESVLLTYDKLRPGRGQYRSTPSSRRRGQRSVLARECHGTRIPSRCTQHVTESGRQLYVDLRPKMRRYSLHVPLRRADAFCCVSARACAWLGVCARRRHFRCRGGLRLPGTVQFQRIYDTTSNATGGVSSVAGPVAFALHDLHAVCQSQVEARVCQCKRGFVSGRKGFVS